MNTLKLITSILVLSGSQLALAKGASKPLDSYEEKSIVTLADRGGVAPETLHAFFESTQAKRSASSDGLLCVRLLTQSPARRNAFLECLSEGGRASLTKNLGEELFILRSELLQKSPTRDRVQTLALGGYIEDLVRENMRSKGSPAVWVTKNGFQKLTKKEQFDFQDGDIVVGLGNSSISSLISQINATPSRYSHAFIVRKRNGKITTVESLIETGVEEFPLQHLIDDPYNQLTVLRWKNKNTRKAVARAASDWAAAAAARKAPYDMEMDFDEDHALYCSEVLVKAYAYASGLRPKQILNHFSDIKSQKAFKFAQNLGVEKDKFASPGDLFNSKYFEVVADYRKPGDLLKSWELYLMGDLFLERIELGYEVSPDPLYAGLPIIVWLGQLIPSIFHEDARLIPKSIGPWAMSIMATTEIKIYDVALKALKDNNGSRSLLDNSPWTMRGTFEREMDEHFAISSSFALPKEKRRRRGGHRNRRRR